MKKFIKFCLFVLCFTSFINFTTTSNAQVVGEAIGDDYPSNWKNAPLGATYDKWGMATRYCTSFVANRLSKVNNFEIKRDGLDWNANNWANNARRQGYVVNNTPAIGSVAAWSSWHVAWVASIDGNNILLEEYNYPSGSGKYHTRWINKSQVENFIHFKDLNSTPTMNLPEKNTPSFTSNGVNYESYTTKVGWMNNVSDNQISGSVGYNLPIESLKISLGNPSINGGVAYRIHVRNVGWLPWVQDNVSTGTPGAGQPIEAIEAKLYGDFASFYDLSYQTHVSEIGWMSWVKNGETSGTTGQLKSVQSLKMKLTRKSITQGNSSVGSQGLSYRAHISEEGWLGYVNDGQLSGTTGLGIPLEKLEVFLDGNSSNIKIDSHVKDIGWINNSGGTTGQNKWVESFKISLQNGYENKYNILYRVHQAETGWSSWVQNGEQAGITGKSRPLQAVQIKIVQK